MLINQKTGQVYPDHNRPVTFTTEDGQRFSDDGHNITGLKLHGNMATAFKGDPDRARELNKIRQDKEREAHKSLKKMARAKVQLAIDTLVDICMNSKTDAARVKAAAELLSRGYGTAHVEPESRLPPATRIQVQFGEGSTAPAGLIQQAVFGPAIHDEDMVSEIDQTDDEADDETNGGDQ